MIENAADVHYVDLQNDMALNSYGYGRWEAPYWFIGPEQGKGRNESADNKKRIKAWLKLGATTVCDCGRFHELIGDDSRHGKKAALQSTWRPLILLLMAFLLQRTEIEDLRAYQRSRWGMENGETCVIELSGIAARNLKTPVDRIQFRQDRITFIREKILKHKPVFVVMYGLKDRESWEQISGCQLNSGDIVNIGSTLAVFTPHPVAHGSTKQYWIDLGKNLRRKYSGS